MSFARSLEQLDHVFWIGGGSGAGKSTIARRIATRLGLSVYSTDEAMAEHARRAAPEACPLLHRFMRMDMDQRWVARSPRAMLETFHWFRGEGFEFILDDLRGRPREPGIVVEGFRLLPHLVKPQLGASNGAVWLLPTPEFRRSVFANRGGCAWGFLARTSDPKRALHNLLERDRMFTDCLRGQTARLGLASIDVDMEMSEEKLAERVMEVFGV